MEENMLHFLLVLVVIHCGTCLEISEEWIITKIHQLAKQDAAHETLIKQQDSVIQSQQQQLHHQTQLANQQQVEIGLLQQQATTYNQRQTELEQQVYSLEKQLDRASDSITGAVHEATRPETRHKLSKINDKPSQTPVRVPVADATDKDNTDADLPNNGIHVNMSKPTSTITLGSLIRTDRLLLGASVDASVPQTVAFHALSDDNQVVDEDDVALFKHELINLGDGYHSLHGLFTAPVQGLYLFSLTMTALNQMDSTHINVFLHKNSEIIGKVYARGDDAHADQGSVTVVTQLQVGDEVWARIDCCQDHGYLGSGYSSFTGVLLFQQ